MDYVWVQLQIGLSSSSAETPIWFCIYFPLLALAPIFSLWDDFLFSVIKIVNL